MNNIIIRIKTTHNTLKCLFIATLLYFVAITNSIPYSCPQSMTFLVSPILPEYLLNHSYEFIKRKDLYLSSSVR